MAYRVLKVVLKDSQGNYRSARSPEVIYPIGKEFIAPIRKGKKGCWVCLSQKRARRMFRKMAENYNRNPENLVCLEGIVTNYESYVKLPGGIWIVKRVTWEREIEIT